MEESNRENTAGRSNMCLVDSGTHMGNKARDPDTSANPGEPVALHNTAIPHNTVSNPTAVSVAPEYIATDPQLRASISAEEIRNTAILQPETGTTVPLNLAQSRNCYSWTEDPDLRAILLSLPTKQDLALLPNRGDLEAVAQRLEGALRKEISEVREQLDIVETGVSNLESAVDNVNTHMDELVVSNSVTQQKFTSILLQVDDLENHSQRNNIHFRVIPENVEDVELRPTIQSVCNNILGKTPLAELIIDRVHRVTPYRSRQGLGP